MRKALIFAMAIFASVAYGNAAERRAKSITRTETKNTISRTNADTQKSVTRATISPRTNATNISQVSRIQTARTATSPTNRTNNQDTRTGRMNNTSRTPTRPTPQNTQTHRGATHQSRATIYTIDSSTTFGTGYNTCRDAYFTCMDQFCATANDSYRRCICSNKLTEIQARERALGNADVHIQDFKNFNIPAITKTATEVNAMLTATTGESVFASAKDDSSSAQKLDGISDVLAGTRKQAMSTQGTLDIAGDINSIWATTNLVGGTNIANLTGEPLYNAVHAQCAELVADACGSQSTQNMVVSAYGMYIENDCSLIINSLDKKLAATNQDIRQTERDMQLARLENYDTHNSASINECIANVRTDITAPTACGADYVHCLDITGLYLNQATGEPIYSSNFYQLENQLSLNGNLLTNQANRMLVGELNRKKTYAQNSLAKCQDISDGVWDEFMRQAITEIYQIQQEKIRTVKNECLDVVNKCYDEKNQSLKDFSNVKEQLLLGARMELSEQLCQEKLDACSNLYGGGTSGMKELLVAMKNITDQTIGKQCLATLRDFVHELCAVPSNDTLHKYPYGCRTYAPGEQQYAVYALCNHTTENISKSEQITDILQGDTPSINLPNTCNITYTSCKPGFYLSEGINQTTPVSSGTRGAYCQSCKKFQNLSENENKTCLCPGGTEQPICTDNGENQSTIINNSVNCGTNYIGSLYHKIARYATQACVRPSEANEDLPATVLQDINRVMDEIHVEMATGLADECERLNGKWINTPWNENLAGYATHQKFYDETSASVEWGFCADPDTVPQTLN